MVLGRPLGYPPHPLGQDWARRHNGGLLLLRLLTWVLDDGDLGRKQFTLSQSTNCLLYTHSGKFCTHHLSTMEISQVRILSLEHSNGKFWL